MNAPLKRGRPLSLDALHELLDVDLRLAVDHLACLSHLTRRARTRRLGEYRLAMLRVWDYIDGQAESRDKTIALGCVSTGRHVLALMEREQDALHGRAVQVYREIDGMGRERREAA